MSATSAPAASDRPSIRDAVAAALSDLGDNTRSRVVEHFANIEAQKRADALVAGLNKLNDFERDLRKINKPDQETFNADGSVASATYSKDRLEAIKKLNDQIEKLTKALNKADDAADFGDLYNLTK